MNSIFSRRALACGALLFYLALGAQALAAQDAQTADSPESSIVLEQERPDSTSEYQSAKNGAGSLVRVVLVLLLVCAGLWGIMNLLKKSTRFSAADDPYLKVLASLPFSAAQSVRVVAVGDRAFLIGLTDHSCTLLAELTDRELIDSMLLESSRTGGAAAVAGFSSLIAKFLPLSFSVDKKNIQAERPSNDDYLSDSAADTADFLRRQRERLRNSGEGDQP